MYLIIDQFLFFFFHLFLPQEKKISTKINYDVLRSLNMSPLVKSNPETSDTKPLDLPGSDQTSGEKRSSSSLAPEPSKRIKVEETPRTNSKIKPNLAGRGSRTKPKVGETNFKPSQPLRSRKDIEAPKTEKRQFNFSAFLGSKSTPLSPEKSSKENIPQSTKGDV